jgi:hypothetical protein
MSAIFSEASFPQHEKSLRTGFANLSAPYERRHRVTLQQVIHRTLRIVAGVDKHFFVSTQFLQPAPNVLRGGWAEHAGNLQERTEIAGTEFCDQLLVGAGVIPKLRHEVDRRAVQPLRVTGVMDHLVEEHLVILLGALMAWTAGEVYHILCCAVTHAVSVSLHLRTVPHRSNKGRARIYYRVQLNWPLPEQCLGNPPALIDTEDDLVSWLVCSASDYYVALLEVLYRTPNFSELRPGYV